MREKLETLPLATLRDMAKAQGLKGVSGFRKSQLIDMLCETAERMEQEKAAGTETAAPAESAGSGEKEEPQERPEERAEAELQGRPPQAEMARPRESGTAMGEIHPREASTAETEIISTGNPTETTAAAAAPVSETSGGTCQSEPGSAGAGQRRGRGRHSGGYVRRLWIYPL